MVGINCYDLGVRDTMDMGNGWSPSSRSRYTSTLPHTRRATLINVEAGQKTIVIVTGFETRDGLRVG